MRNCAAGMSSRTRLPLSGEQLGTRLERAHDPAPDPERQATAADLLTRVESAMHRLPEHFRVILWLRDGEDLFVVAEKDNEIRNFFRSCKAFYRDTFSPSQEDVRRCSPSLSCVSFS